MDTQIEMIHIIEKELVEQIKYLKHMDKISWKSIF
jgi:hypothetical protein